MNNVKMAHRGLAILLLCIAAVNGFSQTTSPPATKATVMRSESQEAKVERYLTAFANDYLGGSAILNEIAYPAGEETQMALVGLAFAVGQDLLLVSTGGFSGATLTAIKLTAVGFEVTGDMIAYSYQIANEGVHETAKDVIATKPIEIGAKIAWTTISGEAPGVDTAIKVYGLMEAVKSDEAKVRESIQRNAEVMAFASEIAPILAAISDEIDKITDNGRREQYISAYKLVGSRYAQVMTYRNMLKQQKSLTEGADLDREIDKAINPSRKSYTMNAIMFNAGKDYTDGKISRAKLMQIVETQTSQKPDPAVKYRDVADILSASNVKTAFENLDQRRAAMNRYGGPYVQAVKTPIDYRVIAQTIENLSAAEWNKEVSEILVEGGLFTMGGLEGDDDMDRDPIPAHNVRLASFWIGKYEITQGQFESVMGSNPSKYQAVPQAKIYPVENITWFDAVRFCNELSKREGLEEVYKIYGRDVEADFSKNGYRLPTEAEWEYAARGGKLSKGFSFSGANRDGLSEVAWYIDSYDEKIGAAPQPVGRKKPNELGLFDMTGNVKEWCWDWMGEVEKGFTINPRGPQSGSERVLKDLYTVSVDKTYSQMPSDVRTKASSDPNEQGPGSYDPMSKFGFRIVRKKVYEQSEKVIPSHEEWAQYRKEKIDWREIAGMATTDLRHLRNYFFAVYGYAFSGDLLDFFGTQSWYKPDPTFKDSRLMEIEKWNVALIKKLETERPYSDMTRVPADSKTPLAKSNSGGVGVYEKAGTKEKQYTTLDKGEKVFLISREKSQVEIDIPTLKGKKDYWFQVITERGVQGWTFGVYLELSSGVAKGSIPVFDEKAKSLIEMVPVQGGSFMMGSNSGRSDQKPVHQVTLSSFMIGKYEITGEQYQKVIGNNPSSLEVSNWPVDGVSWYDAVAFCNKLSDMEDLQRVYKVSDSTVQADFSMSGYRLPTEAEWEYASRGGALSKSYTYSGSDNPNEVGWWGDDGGQLHTVGTLAPNELGLYDMSGNVWEWCWDWYKTRYNLGPETDPMGASSGDSRVIRGGSSESPADELRSTIRSKLRPDYSSYSDLGFRVVRRIDTKNSVASQSVEGNTPKETMQSSNASIETLIPMVSVQGGTFMMGSATGDSDQKPVHQVLLTSFIIGQYEVTQEQYQKVIGINPSYFKNGSEAPKRPVEQVSWYDAVAFCNKLSEMDGLQKVYTISGTDVQADFSRNGYRLPTEAEWEYAARGGSQPLGYAYSGSNDAGSIAWYDGNSSNMTHKVGTKAPNELGLFDMSGNVLEWCYDWYESYSSDTQKDPVSASLYGAPVFRGGCWASGFISLHSTWRNGDKRSSKENTLGFRIARRIDQSVDYSQHILEQQSSDSPIRIGVAIFKVSDDFMQSVRKSILENAIGKAEVEVVDSENYQGKQNDQIDAFLSKKMNVLAINPVERLAAATIIDKAKAMNTPVIFFDREPMPDDLNSWDKVYYVGKRSADPGILQGQIIVDYWKSNPAADKNSDGKIQYIMIKGEPGHMDAELRTQFSIIAVTNAGLVVDKLAEETALWDRAEAFEKMKAFLVAYGDKIEVVFCNNDDMALGAIDALKSYGYFTGKKHIAVVGVGATAPALQAVEEGSLLGTVVVDAKNQGKAIFDLAYTLASGKKATQTGWEIIDGKYIWVPYQLITKENLLNFK